MFVRFPEIVPGHGQNKSISFQNIPYALFSIEKTEGKKTVFLTEHTLIFILKGEKLIHLSDEIIRIDKNKIILLKRGIYAMSEYIPEGESFEALLIFIPDGFLKKLSYKNSKKSFLLVEQLYYIITSNDLLNSFKTHYKNYFGKSLNNLQYILDIKLEELFLLLTSLNGNSQLLIFINSLVQNTPIDLDFILREYLFHPITIPELAKLSGRSVASFKRDFEKQYNTTPRQWINQQRLQQAKLLLNNSTKKVAEIGYECGYENISHFIRIFKNEFGKTPVNARKKTAII